VGYVRPWINPAGSGLKDGKPPSGSESRTNFCDVECTGLVRGCGGDNEFVR